METQTITKKTFKDVQQELDAESLFISGNHNYADFNSKADLLSSVGLDNSIACRLYKAIVDSRVLLSEYNEKYLGQYKFILHPQLERVCEKYNLYLRELKYYIGDIPVKNINDISKFEVCIEDLFLKSRDGVVRDRHSYGLVATNATTRISSGNLRYANLGKLCSIFPEVKRKLKIACVRELLHPEAFARSESRIIDNSGERPPLFEVDLDPIILIEVNGGYIIITAWGDEANDELVVNQNHN